jgi:argininosuccinate lyase
MLERDKSRLADCRKRLNISPLGSGALAGSTINLDRRAIAAELGFDGVTRNSMDAIADRDYIAELLFVISLCGAHLSRLSEDLILWCSAEFASPPYPTRTPPAPRSCRRRKTRTSANSPAARPAASSAT